MFSTSSFNLRSRANQRFWRHYAEMVVVMVLGMAALSMPADWLFGVLGASTSNAHPAMMLFSMALTMTVPMVAWMRYRGHSWRLNVEMAASMLVPALAAIALVWADLVTKIGPLMVIEHVAMLAGMLFVMLLRREEYSGRSDTHGAGRRTAVA